MTKIGWIPLVIVAISFIIGFYFYPRMPEVVASHWNSAGQVNGTMSRFWGTFLMPIISLVLYGFFLVVPFMDPKRENIQKFRKYYDLFITLLFAFLLYIYCLTLAWNLGRQINLIQYMAPAFTILFVFAGVLIGKAEMNWTIGIRTPWTLSNQTVWDKTHKLSSWLFIIAGILCLGGTFFPSLAIWFVLIPILLAALISILYSYFVFRAEKAK